ncbi:pyridoxal phosphate-dependent aminotransferase [Corynebacterium pyruviciproducens]|uniref:Pyridoxal phosphate-dependent aminotransferase n=1 Tax=Corynebacterium pyruviciproducens TaxID=598660 RepID=A0AAF1BRZ9_9CORY|nr:pyridoxal phosphate-dependent aminotransferase [Corynebacterium pyruviciproducens]MDH4657607.1 pyridoxal phosphate-dependent aminotransferase [Corynebacterium pyruviciproducens]MDK6566797.1 pyridoxal phosphate-dependent aminotransferase [Corynebacterium pyruviciproducens]WOT02298.1 pyridoxal phosphate-dependent aminotransferase [Corynebacterium pyruviciproducens]
MRFSSRVSVTEPNRIAAACTPDVLDASDSNPTHHGLAPRRYAADPRGERAAREQLSAFIGARDGRTVDPDRLYLVSSTSQAYAWLTKLLCDPGDTLLVPRPGYPLVDSLAALETVGTQSYRLEWAGSWLVDALSLTPSPSARGVVLINPNNPTGSYLSGGELDFFASLGLPLIADEVFFEFPLDDAVERHRIAGEDRVLTFALDGMSKNLAAPYAKLGWIEVSGPGDQVEEALKRLDIIADAYLPVGHLILDHLPAMLEAIPSQQARVRERVRGNLEALKALASGVVTVYPPEGGWNVLLRFPDVIDEEDLVVRLIQEERVTVQPGFFFDMRVPGFVSLSLLLEPDAFANAARRILQVIEEVSL